MATFSPIIELFEKSESVSEQTQIAEYLIQSIKQHKPSPEDVQELSELAFRLIDDLLVKIPAAPTYKAKDELFNLEDKVLGLLLTLYGSPNKVVREDPEYIEEMGEEAMEILYGNEVHVSNFEDLCEVETDKLKVSFYTAISNTEENGNLLDLTNALWSEMKVESSIEPWIIVVDAVIVVSLAGAILFSVLRKRHREKYY